MQTRTFPSTVTQRHSTFEHTPASTLGDALQAHVNAVQSSNQGKKSKCAQIYALGGMIFGLTFIFAGLLIDIWWRHLDFSMSSLSDMFSTNPLHIIIAMAPLVLASVFYVLGLRQDRLRNELSLRLSAQELARFESSHDSLTGFANRRQFQENLVADLKKIQSDSKLLVIVLLDIDLFKHINDTFGHYAGDELIRMVSKRLASALQEGDTLARFGADEMGMLWHNMSDPASVQDRLDELMSLFETPFLLNTYSLRVTVSAGAALAPLHGQDPISMFKAADIALFRAKAEGRARSCLFTDEMGAALKRRRRIELGLDQAVKVDDQLTVFYQPLVKRDGCSVATAEALVRWTLPDGSTVSPGEFIPIAEETGLIWQLGEWVMRRVFSQANRWPEVTLAINLSPVQLRRNTLISVVEAFVHEYDVAPSRIEFEVTEGVLLENHMVIQENLDALRAMGFKIALDDFGTGYSSLSYLRKFAFHKIKIDQSFVRGIGVSTESEEIARAIVSIGRALGMRLVAEGVETPEQFSFLQEIGCDEFQGYLFAKPMPHHMFWDHLHGATKNKKNSVWPKDDSLPAQAHKSPAGPTVNNIVDAIPEQNSSSAL